MENVKVLCYVLELENQTVMAAKNETEPRSVKVWGKCVNSTVGVGF